MKTLSYLVAITVGLSMATSRAEVPWPQSVLNEAFHAGDDSVKEMQHQKPDGPRFSGEFTLPATIKPQSGALIVVELSVAGIAPRSVASTAKAESEGKGPAKLVINGEAVSMLNSLMRGMHSNVQEQTVKIVVPGKFLREGRNEIEVVPGGGKGKLSLDDCEIYRITVSSHAG